MVVDRNPEPRTSEAKRGQTLWLTLTSMPICTHCTHPTPYLYTAYESAYNLRLEQCPNCKQFADPYVEHDSLTIFLDLLLLKRGVFRHLLYNNGAPPRLSAGKNVAKAGSRHPNHWFQIIQLGLACVSTDCFIRWAHLYSSSFPITIPWTKSLFLEIFRVFLGTAAETIAFHSGIVILSYFALLLQSSLRPGSTNLQSISRSEFRLSMVPLSLFYSSIPKLFLLSLLTIWGPTSSRTLSSGDGPPLGWLPQMSDDNPLKFVLKFLNDDILDREWLVRNLLGGMSAGFGLRVILDIRPILTTLIIVGGWYTKSVMTSIISPYLLKGPLYGESWLEYNIP